MSPWNRSPAASSVARSHASISNAARPVVVPDRFGAIRLRQTLVATWRGANLMFAAVIALVLLAPGIPDFAAGSRARPIRPAGFSRTPPITANQSFHRAGPM